MVEKIPQLPANMIGFKTAGDIFKRDLTYVKSEVKQLFFKTDKLNYLILFDNAPSDFTLATWLYEALLDIKNIKKWSRTAIVTDCPRMMNFANVVNGKMPGVIKGFKKSDYALAIDWTSEKIDLT